MQSQKESTNALQHNNHYINSYFGTRCSPVSKISKFAEKTGRIPESTKGLKINITQATNHRAFEYACGHISLVS